MAELDDERLYAALPAVIRARDEQSGEPLRALMKLLERQLDQIRDETDTTWNNWFIETCEEWLVPYIGDALGVRGLRSIDAIEFSLRAFVANTIAHRRRKGTALGLEQLARDLTQYAARVVEYFRRTAVDYHTQVPLRQSLTTVDLRDPLALEGLGGPFCDVPHTPELRRVEPRLGRYNLANLGVHLWRSLGWRVVRSSPALILAKADEGWWFHFDPHGRALNLFNHTEAEADISVVAQLRHVPHALSLRELAARELATKQLPADDETVAVWVPSGADGELEALPVRPCHLGATPADAVRGPEPGVALVDPVRGRLLIHASDLGPDPDPDHPEIRVDYWQGHGAELGAGPWGRETRFEIAGGEDAPTWTFAVGEDGSLAEAVDQWNAHVAGTAAAVGVIALLDNTSHAAPPAIALRPSARLLIVAAAGTHGDALVAPGHRGVVRGGLRVIAQPSDPGSGEDLGELVLNGLSLEGPVEVGVGELGRLSLEHCSIARPAAEPGVVVRSAAVGTNGDLELVIRRSCISALSCDGPIGGLSLTDSVVAGPLRAPSSRLAAQGVTFLAEVAVGQVEASSSLFAGPLDCERRQRGCLRYSYVSPGSRAPRTYRCVPASTSDPAPLRPVFESLDPCHFAYARLRDDAAPELRFGGEGGSEIGAHHHLQHGRRLANLRAVLDQYLRHGLAAGVFTEN